MADSKNMSAYGQIKSFNDFNKLSEEDKLKHYLSLNQKQRNQLIPSDYEHGIIETKPTLDSPNNEKFLRLYKKQKDTLPDLRDMRNDINVSDFNNSDEIEPKMDYDRFKQTFKTIHPETVIRPGQIPQNLDNADRHLDKLNFLLDNQDISSELKQRKINAKLEALRQMGLKVDLDEDRNQFYFND